MTGVGGGGDHAHEPPLHVTITDSVGVQVGSGNVLNVHLHDRTSVYGIPVRLTPLSARAAVFQCTIAGLLAALGCVLAAAGATAPSGSTAMWRIIAGIAALMAAHAVGSTTWRRWLLAQHRSQAALDRRVADLIAHLAEKQERQWRDEAIIRRIQGARLLPVLCRTAGHDLFDHWSNIRAGQRTDDPLDLDGDVTEIERIFARIPSGRLVILGEPGAGKSVAALRLGLHYLEHRRHRHRAGRAGPDERVPVILPLATWDPAASGLWRWAAQRLATEHPELAAPTDSGATLADEVATPERVLLILDGFDEIPADRRTTALRALNDGLGEHTHFVLTSRPGQYREAVRQADVLSGAAAVTLQPLTVDQLIKSLLTSTRRVRPDGGSVWDRVAERLRHGRDPQANRLRTALSSPLMLGLALIVYVNADPSELLDATKFPTLARIEEHLIERFVPAVYDTPRDVGRAPRWRAGQAHRWLVHLARDAAGDESSGGELAWWSWYRRQATIATAAAVALVYAATVILTAALPLHGDIRWQGVALPPWAALALVGAVPLLLAIVDVGLTTPPPASPGLRRRLPVIIARAAVSAAGIGFTWLLSQTRSQPSYPYTFPTFVSGGTDVSAVQHSYQSGFPAVMVIGLSVLFVVRAVPVMANDVAVSTPRTLLRADRTAALAWSISHSVSGPRRWCLEAFVLLPIAILVAWNDHAGAGQTGSAVWVTVFAGVAAITIAHGLTNTAWGRYNAARAVLAATGRLPWRTMAFLDDAHARGVLRQSSGRFEFRHGRLFDHLVGSLPAPPLRDILPRRVARVVRRWPAPLLTGIVLVTGTSALTGSVSQIVRAPGRYRALPPACSLLDAPTLTTALRGRAIHDYDAEDYGGLYVSWPADYNAWCSWHSPVNGSTLGLATVLSGPTNDKTGPQVAQDSFAWVTTGPNTSVHLDLAASPCDWGHEYEELSPADANAFNFERAVVLCQNVLIEIDYRSDKPDAPHATDTYAETQQLLHAVAAGALRPAG